MKPNNLILLAVLLGGCEEKIKKPTTEQECKQWLEREDRKCKSGNYDDLHRCVAVHIFNERHNYDSFPNTLNRPCLWLFENQDGTNAPIAR